MPQRPHPPHLRARLLDRVAAGERLKDVCAEPGMPCAAAVAFWARREPEFAAALATARARGAHRRKWAFHEPTARALIARLAAGETIAAILSDPAMPSRRVYAYWRATDAAFAEDVGRLNAVKQAEKIARCQRRLRAFDRARADAILARVITGARLVDVPERPASSVLARWRREQPAFDAELKAAMAFARARRRRLGTATPELLDAVWERVLEGETLAAIGLDPAMPCRTTLYAWMRRNPAFRDSVAQALHFRRDWLCDMIMQAGRGRGAGAPGAKREWENLHGKAERIEARLERWGYYD